MRREAKTTARSIPPYLLLCLSFNEKERERERERDRQREAWLCALLYRERSEEICTRPYRGGAMEF